MFNDMILKACATIHTNIATARRAENEAGITAIEYAIIGVAMASGLFFIFDEGGFLKSLQMAWQTMGTKIISAGNILN